MTSIGNYAFYGCTGLTSVTIGNSVKSIVDDAFGGCSGLTSITIPNSVTSIGWSAFENCSGLTTITIGDGIKEIRGSAFANCPDLLDVYCYARKGPTTGSDVFKDSRIEYTTLHVPAAALTGYKTIAPWSGFMEVVPLTDQELSIDGIISANKEIVRYTLGGQRTTSPQKGLNIIRMSDGTTRKVVGR